MGFTASRAIYLFFIPILIAAGVGCFQTHEPVDQPIVITPVAFQTQTPAEEGIPAPRYDWREFIPPPTPIPAAVATAVPTPLAVATPTPTPWPTTEATLWPTATATPLPLPTAAPTITSRPTSTPVPTLIPTPTMAERWAQVQRDYRDGLINYDQAVEQAIDAGMSRPQARIAVAQIQQRGSY